MNDGPPQVVLIRHAETEWSRSGRHTGHTDIPLTDHGRQVAAELPPLLSDWDFARVLVSPLGRARETARLAGLDAGAKLREDLMEWDYGEYEGITTPEILERRPGWVLWRDGCPGGETSADVGARVDRVIDEVRRIDGNVAVVAHGHLLRVLAARWIGLEPTAGALLALSTAAVCVLGYERDTSVLWRWNDARAAPRAEAQRPAQEPR